MKPTGNAAKGHSGAESVVRSDSESLIFLKTAPPRIGLRRGAFLLSGGRPPHRVSFSCARKVFVCEMGYFVCKKQKTVFRGCYLPKNIDSVSFLCYTCVKLCGRWQPLHKSKKEKADTEPPALRMYVDENGNCIAFDVKIAPEG